MEALSQYGKEVMEAYAKDVGAEYRFDMNPTFIAKRSPHPSHMSALRPIFDEEFHSYDKVLYIDCDIFPVYTCDQNIFDEPVNEIGICEEKHMPALRVLNPQCQDDKWDRTVKELYGKSLPRNEQGLVRVFNTGLVMYTREGMIKAKANFEDMRVFVSKFQPRFNRPLYYRDQSYLPVMLEVGDIDYTIMDTKWNSQIHWKPNTHGPNRPIIDMRTADTQFVHVQLTGSGEWSRDKIWKAVNTGESND